MKTAPRRTQPSYPGSQLPWLAGHQLTGAKVVNIALQIMKLTPNAIESIAAHAASISVSAENDAVPSPCRSLCSIDESTRLCRGCLRTLNEIQNWRNANQAEKRIIWTRIARRLIDHAE